MHIIKCVGYARPPVRWLGIAAPALEKRLQWPVENQVGATRQSLEYGDNVVEIVVKACVGGGHVETAERPGQLELVLETVRLRQSPNTAEEGVNSLVAQIECQVELFLRHNRKFAEQDDAQIGILRVARIFASG